MAPPLKVYTDRLEPKNSQGLKFCNTTSKFRSKYLRLLVPMKIQFSFIIKIKIFWSCHLFFGSPQCVVSVYTPSFLLLRHFLGSYIILFHVSLPTTFLSCFHHTDYFSLSLKSTSCDEVFMSEILLQQNLTSTDL